MAESDVTTSREREHDTMRGDEIDLRSGEIRIWLDENAAYAVEWARRARLARWQQGTGNERDEARHRRQTTAARAQDARSASEPRNSDPH